MSAIRVGLPFTHTAKGSDYRCIATGAVVGCDVRQVRVGVGSLRELQPDSVPVNFLNPRFTMPPMCQVK